MIVQTATDYVTDWTVIQASHGLDVQSVTGIGHFLKSSNPSHGLDVQSVTWIGHPIRDTLLSRIGHPTRDLDWPSNP